MAGVVRAADLEAQVTTLEGEYRRRLSTIEYLEECSKGPQADSLTFCRRLVEVAGPLTRQPSSLAVREPVPRSMVRKTPRPSRPGAITKQRCHQGQQRHRAEGLVQESRGSGSQGVALGLAGGGQDDHWERGQGGVPAH
jgi:hypothetical protein